MTPDDGRLNILTIDGPAGVGKSSVARRVAGVLGYFHLDTGAMYRAVTLACLRRGVTAADLSGPAGEASVQAIVAGLGMEVGAGGRIWLVGVEVTGELRSAAVNGLVSPVSALPAVRHALVDLQRRIGMEKARASQGVVVEGRDAGSYIFPAARWRFYLDASLAERARRRLKQEVGERLSDADLTAAMEALAQRDRIDRERSVAPLKVPDGAMVLDTTHVGFEEVVATIVRVVRPPEGTPSQGPGLDRSPGLDPSS